MLKWLRQQTDLLEDVYLTSYSEKPKHAELWARLAPGAAPVVEQFIKTVPERYSKELAMFHSGSWPRAFLDGLASRPGSPNVVDVHEDEEEEVYPPTGRLPESVYLDVWIAGCPPVSGDGGKPGYLTHDDPAADGRVVHTPTPLAQPLFDVARAAWSGSCRTLEELANHLNAHGLRSLTGASFSKASVRRVVIAIELLASNHRYDNP